MGALQRRERAPTSSRRCARALEPRCARRQRMHILAWQQADTYDKTYGKTYGETYCQMYVAHVLQDV